MSRWCFVWVFVYVLLLVWYASSSIELFGCDSFFYNYITNGLSFTQSMWDNIAMSDSTANYSTIYDLNNGSYASNSPYAISAFPRTMVSLQLNATDGSQNLVINQQLCNTNGILQTNMNGILLSASGFTELLIQLQGLEMIFNRKKTCTVTLTIHHFLQSMWI